MSELELFNPQYEKGVRLTDLQKTIDFLDNREKFTYAIDGIEGIEVIDNGLKMILDVVEVDDHLKTVNNAHSKEEIEFFVSKYVFNHLSTYLEIPSTLYAYYQRFLKLESDDYHECKDSESKILKTLFEDRHKKGNKTDFITTFKDGFGWYPRVIHSKVYYPYKDSEALDKMVHGFQSINARSELDYQFHDAFITPYKTTLTFHNVQPRQTFKIVGDEYQSGLVIQNSECKGASFNFRAVMTRLACSNGMISNFNRDLSVRHYEGNFERKIQIAFSEALKLPERHAQRYLNALSYDEKISDDWADFVEIPSKFVSMRKNEKEEIAMIGAQQGYEMNVNGIVQALTYKNTHRVYDDDSYERINDKVLQIVDNARDLSNWKPKRIQALSN